MFIVRQTATTLMLQRILVAIAAFASSPHNKLLGVQGFVTPTRLHSTIACQTLTSHLSAREGGGSGGRGGRGRGGRKGRGGRGRGRNDREERRSAPPTSGDSAEGDKETESSKPTLSYRERWFQAHPNYIMDRNNNRRGRKNGNRSGGGRRGRTPPPGLPSPGHPGRNCHRDAISFGNKVYVVKKEDQQSGRETSGTVSRLLTNSRYHPRGIKVMLDGGIVGRVTRFDDGGDLNLSGTNINNPNDASNASDEEDAYNATSSQTQTLADFLPSMGSNNHADASSMTHEHPSSSEANTDALATLAGMGFDKEKGNQALQMFDNDVERAANYLLNE